MGASDVSQVALAPRVERATASNTVTSTAGATSTTVVTGETADVVSFTGGGVSSTTSTTLAPLSRATAPVAASSSPFVTLPPVTVTLPLKLGPTLKSVTSGLGWERGQASWFDAPEGTCAHQTLPFGTVIKVTRVFDGASTTCRVDDRGPFITGRVIDLSYDTFEELAHPGSGVIEVLIEW